MGATRIHGNVLLFNFVGFLDAVAAQCTHSWNQNKITHLCGISLIQISSHNHHDCSMTHTNIFWLVAFIAKSSLMKAPLFNWNLMECGASLVCSVSTYYPISRESTSVVKCAADNSRTVVPPAAAVTQHFWAWRENPVVIRVRRKCGLEFQASRCMLPIVLVEIFPRDWNAVIIQERWKTVCDNCLRQTSATKRTLSFMSCGRRAERRRLYRWWFLWRSDAVSPENFATAKVFFRYIESWPNFVVGVWNYADECCIHSFIAGV